MLQAKKYCFILLFAINSISLQSQNAGTASADSSLLSLAKNTQKPPLFEVLVSSAGFASAWTNRGLYRGINFFDPVFGPWVIPSAEFGGLVQFNPELGKKFNNFLFIRTGLAIYHSIGDIYFIPANEPIPGAPDGISAGLAFYRRNNLAFPLYLGTQFTLRNTPSFFYLGTEFISPPKWMNENQQTISGYNLCKNSCPYFGFPYNLNLKTAIGIQPRKKFLHSASVFIEQTRWKTIILNIGLELNFRVFKYE